MAILFVENVHVVYINKFSFFLSFLFYQAGVYFNGFLWQEDSSVAITVKWCIRNSIWVLFQRGSLKTVFVKRRAVCPQSVVQRWCAVLSHPVSLIFLVSVACIRQKGVSSIKALNSTRNGKSTVSVGIFSHWLPVLFILLILLLQAIHFH